MQVIFEYHNVSGSQRLEEFAKEKLEQLGIKYKMVIRADVFFKTENTSSDQTGNICNIRLSLPGPRLFAEANHDSFEESITESINELESQLKKRKGKMTDY